MSKKLVIAGGSGFIGRALSKRAAEMAYEVVVLSRRAGSGQFRTVLWDGASLGDWRKELEGAEGVINVSGERISLHWSEANKLAIQESRILSTRVLGEAIRTSQNPPKAWINSSAIGYYGDRGDEILTEESPPGAKGHFLADLCFAWEHEQDSADTPQTRKVCIRTGVVMGKGSGAFDALYTVTRFFLGGHVGDGRQFVSWIHIDDLVELCLWALRNEVPKTLNGTAPEPVTNEDLMLMFRAIMRRPWAPPVPAFILRLFSMLGGPDASLLLESQRVLPKAGLDAGLGFRYPRLREALSDLIVGG